jgi:hypothetical protein
MSYSLPLDTLRQLVADGKAYDALHAKPKKSWSAHDHMAVADKALNIEAGCAALAAFVHAHLPADWPTQSWSFYPQANRTVLTWAPSKSNKHSRTFPFQESTLAFVLGTLVGLGQDSLQGKTAWPGRLTSLGLSPKDLPTFHIAVVSVNGQHSWVDTPARGLGDALGRLGSMERFGSFYSLFHTQNALSSLEAWFEAGLAAGQAMRRKQPKWTIVPWLRERLLTHPVLARLREERHIPTLPRLPHDKLLLETLERHLMACLRKADGYPLPKGKARSPHYILKTKTTGRLVQAWDAESALLLELATCYGQLTMPNPQNWKACALQPAALNPKAFLDVDA